jgi:hypothetical protein
VKNDDEEILFSVPMRIPSVLQAIDLREKICRGDDGSYVDALLINMLALNPTNSEEQEALNFVADAVKIGAEVFA